MQEFQHIQKETAYQNEPHMLITQLPQWSTWPFYFVSALSTPYFIPTQLFGNKSQASYYFICKHCGSKREGLFKKKNIVPTSLSCLHKINLSLREEVTETLRAGRVEERAGKRPEVERGTDISMLMGKEKAHVAETKTRVLSNNHPIWS